MDQLKTPEQVKADFKRSGISIARWAAMNGLTEGTVYSVLKGKTIGLRGNCHRAAVLLGIKDGVIAAEESQQTYGPTPEMLTNGDRKVAALVADLSNRARIV